MTRLLILTAGLLLVASATTDSTPTPETAAPATDSTPATPEATPAPVEKEEEKPIEWLSDDGVYILEPWVVEKFKKEFPNFMILFYGRGCGNCQWMMGEYRKAAKAAVQKNLNIKFAMMNAIANREFPKNLGARGFPHIHVFGEKAPAGYKYRGKMNVQDFLKEMRQHSDGTFVPTPTKTVTLTDKNYKDFIAQERAFVIFTHLGDDNIITPIIDETILSMQEDGEELIMPVGILNTTTYKGLANAEEATRGALVFRKGIAFDFWTQSNQLELREEMVGRYYLESNSQELTLANVEGNAQIRGEFFEGTGTQNVIIFAMGGQDYKQEAIHKWMRQCYKNEDVRCGHTFDRALIKKYKMKNYHIMWNRPKLWPLRKSQKPSTTIPKKPIKLEEGFVGVWTDEIKANLLPLVGPYDVEAFQNRAHWDSMAVVVAYFNLDFGRDQSKMVKLMAKVARKFDGITHPKAPVQFAIADEIANHEFLTKFGLQGREAEDDPVIVIHDCYNHTDHAPSADEQYLKNAKFEDYLEDVTRRYLDDQIPALNMSEPEPRHQTKPILTLVQSTFNQTVTDPEKDVVVFMTKEGCHECDVIEGWLKEIAEQLVEMGEPIIITKIDMSKNTLDRDVWPYQDGPKLYMVPGGSRKEEIEWFPGHLDINPHWMKKFMGSTAKLSFKNCQAPKKETFKDIVGAKEETKKGKDEL